MMSLEETNLYEDSKSRYDYCQVPPPRPETDRDQVHARQMGPDAGQTSAVQTGIGQMPTQQATSCATHTSTGQVCKNFVVS